jgi:hypothetical protein
MSLTAPQSNWQIPAYGAHCRVITAGDSAFLVAHGICSGYRMPHSMLNMNTAANRTLSCCWIILHGRESRYGPPPPNVQAAKSLRPCPLQPRCGTLVSSTGPSVSASQPFASSRPDGATSDKLAFAPAHFDAPTRQCAPCPPARRPYRSPCPRARSPCLPGS